MRFWLSISILLTSFLSTAQEYTLYGYIIYKNGDTIRTRIAVTGSFSTGVFEKQMMKEVKTIASNNQVRIYLSWDLLGYGFSKADQSYHFSRVYIKGEKHPLFLKPEVISPEISLYSVRHYGTTGFLTFAASNMYSGSRVSNIITTYIFQNAAGDYISVDKFYYNKKRKQLTQFFSWSPEIASLYNKTVKSFEDLSTFAEAAAGL